MAAIARSEAILDLGKKLVRELSEVGERDTLAAWMAHFIAEKMDAVEGSSSADRGRAQNECATAVLALWAHRGAFPDGSRPFEQIEPIARAIADLDPEQASYRYYPRARKAADDAVGEPEVRWLDLAKGLDDTARQLVRLCLQNAARDALDDAQDWVALAAEAGEDRGMDITIVAFLSEDEDRAATASVRMREELERRLGRLEAFVGASEMLAADIRCQIVSLS